MIKCLEFQIVCVGKPRTKRCLGEVLEIAQTCKGQDSRM